MKKTVHVAPLYAVESGTVGSNCKPNSSEHRNSSLLIVTSTAGCAAGGYNSKALERRLESTGVSPAAAKCVVDRMPGDLGEQRIGARANPTPEEFAAERKILRECGVKV